VSYNSFRSVILLRILLESTLLWLPLQTDFDVIFQPRPIALLEGGECKGTVLKSIPDTPVVIYQSDPTTN